MMLAKVSWSPAPTRDELVSAAGFWGVFEAAAAWSYRAAFGACLFAISLAGAPALRSSITAEFRSVESTAKPAFQLSDHSTVGLVAVAAVP